MGKTKQLEKINGPNGIVWKVGDKVIVPNQFSEHISTITRITDGRGGTIYINIAMNCSTPEIAYDIKGYLRGSDKWSCNHISPATQEDIARIKGKVARLQLSNFKWLNISPDIAIEIRDYLRTKYNLEIGKKR